MDTTNLTETQQAILQLIAERIESEGAPPSQTEIARAFGFKQQPPARGSHPFDALPLHAIRP